LFRRQAGLNIRSADLRWRRSHITVSGKLKTLRQAWQIDMDVAADHLVWGELSAVLGAGDSQGVKQKLVFSYLGGGCSG
jgi:hypothetical protein